MNKLAVAAATAGYSVSCVAGTKVQIPCDLREIYWFRGYIFIEVLVVLLRTQEQLTSDNANVRCKSSRSRY